MDVGLTFPIAFSQSKGIAVEGLIAEVAETFSNDSEILIESPSVMLLVSASKVKDGGLFALLGLCVSILLPSEDRDTE